MTPQEQDFLDRCAIEAMVVIQTVMLGQPSIIVDLQEKGKDPSVVAASDAYYLADRMLTERRKRIDHLKVQADNPNEAM